MLLRAVYSAETGGVLEACDVEAARFGHVRSAESSVQCNATPW